MLRQITNKVTVLHLTFSALPICIYPIIWTSAFRSFYYIKYQQLLLRSRLKRSPLKTQKWGTSFQRHGYGKCSKPS